MKLAILHHHLNRGGVAGVIANQVRALNEASPETGQLAVALIHGGRSAGWSTFSLDDLRHLDFSAHTVPELDYDEEVGSSSSSQQLAARIQDTLSTLGFHPAETVLHVHNHALGKNARLPGALIRLASAGYGLLLQLHDFAEDFRPENYRRLAEALDPSHPERLPAQLYPQGTRVHYALLNHRDLNILAAAGVCTSRLHYVPNIVSGIDRVAEAADAGSAQRRQQARHKLRDRFGVALNSGFILYPVRGIRRKNLGEVLLWSKLVGANATIGITLAPLNPRERTSYNRWKDLARQLQLPCLFEVGGENGLQFAENLQAADLILTTSVAEGFGLVFLETWLAGRPLIGRDLPEITVDFRAAGIRLDGLRGQLLIPIDWVGESTFCESFGQAYGQVLRDYWLPVPSQEQLAATARQLVREGMVDFAYLPGLLQSSVIARLAGSPSGCARLHRENRWIEEALNTNADADVVRENADIVRKQFSGTRHGRQLCEIYRRILAESPDRALVAPRHGEAILESFLSLYRFHPLRIES